MDGTVWTESDISSNLRVSTELDDILYGSNAADSLNGLGGNDNDRRLGQRGYARRRDRRGYPGRSRETIRISSREAPGKTQ